MKWSMFLIVMLIVLLPQPLLFSYTQSLDGRSVKLVESTNYGLTSSNGYVNVNVSEAKQMIETNPNLVTLDVRTQEEYNEGHIENAVLIPVNELEERIDELDNEKETVVYCRSGVRSVTASEILVANGFSNVYNMLGGITAWRDAGYWIEIIHTGDLIIDGTETFTIENCTYIQTGNIIIKDHAKLIIRNAKVFLNLSTDLEYYVHIEDYASVLAEHSIVDTFHGIHWECRGNSHALFNSTDMLCSYPGDISIDAYDNSKLSFINSQANEVGSIDFDGNSEVNIENSTCECAATYGYFYVCDSTILLMAEIFFWDGASVAVEGLNGGTGHIAYFNTYDNLTVTGGHSGNLTIINSTIVNAGITLIFTFSSGNISRSILGDIVTHDAYVTVYESIIRATISSGDSSMITITNSSVLWYVASWVNSVAIIRGSTVNQLHVYQKSNVSISNSTLGTMIAYQFSGVISLDDVIVESKTEFKTSQFYVYGNVSFAENVSIKYWTNSNVTRNFNIIVSNRTEYPLADVELTLYEQNDAIWTSFTDNLGKANFNLTFTHSNYTDILRLKAVRGNFTATEYIGLLSDTPIILTVRYFVDLNGDGTVNILDIAIVARAYGTKEGDPNWNPVADIAEPYGEINILDIAKIAKDYGKTV